MAAHKHYDCIVAWANGEQIEWSFGDDEWRPLNNNEPRWDGVLKYRIKPAESEKVYPVTKMTADQLFEYFISSSGSDNSQACVVVANKALQHACDNGQIVTREEFDRAITDRKERDVLVAVAAGRAMYNAIYSVLPIRRDYCDIALDIEAIIAEVK